MWDTHGIIVPFPEVMTQQDYNDLYYRQIFFDSFDMVKYEQYCDLIDKRIKQLLDGEKEVYINYCDIYNHLNINYGITKKELLEVDGIHIEIENDHINHRFVLRLEGE